MHARRWDFLDGLGKALLVEDIRRIYTLAARVGRLRATTATPLPDNQEGLRRFMKSEDRKTEDLKQKTNVNRNRREQSMRTS